jgi:hypothetical protein
LIYSRFESFAKYSTIKIKLFNGGIKVDSQTQGSTTSITCDTLSIATGNFSALGCLGKEVKNATELALLELKRIIRDCIAPDHCHWRKLWLQVSHNHTFHTYLL